MTAPLLETKGLSKRYGGVEAVRDVCFSLAEGELRCLIGPNGAGKSTFFKMLTGQIAPSSGEVAFRGRRIDRLATHEIARLGIGIKTQVPSLFDGLSLRENLWLGASRHFAGREIAQAADGMLARLHLEPLADRQVGQLAHGQRQWVELGIALLGEPALLLLDEPAAGMTQDETVRTAELIREINRTHAIVVVEHDMQFVRSIARTVTVFNQGAVLAEAGIEDILRDPRVRDIYLGRQAAA
ncbi:MAG: ATP-binding cassette domain-containing protein [Stellaceae bacterium]